MEDNKETNVLNTEDGSGEGADAQGSKPADNSVMDDDIQYTFVVPKGEIYREPEEDAAETENPEDKPAEPAAEEPVMEWLKDGNDAGERKAAVKEAPSETIFVDKRHTAGAADDEEIIYTFVVPKGEVYKEPEPTATIVAGKEMAEAVKAGTPSGTIIADKAAFTEGEAETQTDNSAAETIVVKKGDVEDGADGKKTRYGLPVDHPEMGELAKKQEARRIYKETKKNRFRTRFYVITTLAIVIIAGLILSVSSLFTVDSIEVQGNSHYTAEEIINMSHASPGRNIIYKANIKETTQFLEQNPYIKNAEVKRRLPSTIVIKVTEREEKLAFKYDDDYLAMDEDGIVLKKTRNKPKTTLIKGIVVSKIKLGEKIGTEKAKKMDQVIELVKMMTASDLYFVKIDVSDDKTVEAYIYDTLVVKTDYDTLMTNMENGRLHLVVEKLVDDDIERGTITFEEDGSASFIPRF